jgi:hypothetical protein
MSPKITAKDWMLADKDCRIEELEKTVLPLGFRRASRAPAISSPRFSPLGNGVKTPRG